MNSNISVENKYSFLDLVNEFKIQIPILQRDYVQGRNTESVREIRENFVVDLVEHVSVETDKILPLDFIYGYADEEFGKYDREISKNNIESLLDTIKNYSLKENFKLSYNISDQKDIVKNLFIPLDGQQRLTTLFLLHFYVALKHKPERLSILKEKLTYKTRKSSDKFCQVMLHYATTLNQSLPIADAIQDATWFLIGWKKDPTIEGILVMLQTIENKFLSYADFTTRLNYAFENLFENPKIYFDFLDMNEQGLADDIYLKMNSTGKELSDYDNFKSWFVSKVEIILEDNNSYKSKTYFENWKEKLDQEWYNLFWMVDPTQADKLFFNFIKSILSYSIISLNEEEKLIKEKFEKLNSDSFLPLKFFEENKLISIDNINVLFCVLEELSDEQSPLINTISEIWSSNFSNGKMFKTSLLTELQELSLPHKLFFQSCFLMMVFKADLDLSVFRKWLRVFRNIIYNTRIDDFSRFDTPVKVLTHFITKNRELVIDNERWIDFFDGKQVREEFEKLAFENDRTITDFELLESHFYLYGQIFFLIDWSIDDNADDFDTFKIYTTRFVDLFSEDHLSSNEFILQRALLVMKDNWMPDKGSNRYSFCKNTYNTARERDENWRILFNKANSEILTLLQNNICKTEELLSYILSNQDSISDWRKFLTEDSTLIAKCEQRLINKGSNGNFIRLLDKTKLSGYHTELRTWVLYKQLKKEFNLSNDKIDYLYVEAGDKDCRIRFVDIGVYILYNRDSNKFCFETYNNETNNYDTINSYTLFNPDIISFIEKFNLRLNT